MTAKLNKMDLLKWGITLAIMLILFLIPETGFYTWNVKMFFVITMGGLCCIAMDMLPLTLIGLLLPFLWILFNVAPAAVVFSPWTNLALYTMLGALIFGAGMGDSGLLKRISFWMMTKINGSWYKLLLGFFVTGVFLSLITFAGGYVLFIALVASFCISVDIMKTKKAVVLALVCMVASIASKAFIYCPGNYSIILGAAQSVLPGFTINFVQAIAANWPMMFVALAIVFIVAKIFYKDDTPLEGRAYFEERLAEMGPITRKEKAAAIVLIIMIALLLVTPFMGQDPSLIFCLVPLLLFIPGIDAADPKCLNQVDYGMVFFGGCCIGIGAVSSYLGLGVVLGNILTPLFNSGNTFMIFGLLFLVIFVLNFLLTPVAIYGVLSVPLFTICLGLGLDPSTFVFAMMHSAELVLFPYEYLPYLVLFSFGMVTMKDFIKVNIIRTIIYFAGIMLILVPYWHLIGLL